MAETRLFHRVPALINGVSRQAPTLRFPNQVEEATNANFSIVDGISKRHGTTVMTHFRTGVTPTVDYRFHKIERDATEEYLIIIGSLGGDPFKVVNVNDGEVADVVFESGTAAYLSEEDPTPDDLRFSTVADTTFIINRKVVTASQTVDGATNGALDQDTMPVILQRTNATAGSLEFTCSQPVWKERNHYQQILKTDSDPSSGNFRLKYEGDGVCKIDEGEDDDGNPIPQRTHELNWDATALEVEEYLGGNGVVLGDAGLTVQHPAIEGLRTIPYGKVSCVGGPLPEKDIVINFSTDLDVDQMIKVIDNSVGGLEMQRGSEDNNPAPTFAKDGLTLRDVSFHKDRLVLAADEYINFSQAGDIYNFFIETADNIVDSDPIETILSSDEITVIDFVIPHHKSLIIFTTTGKQFELDQAGDVLSPSTTTIVPSTAYEIQSVRPVAIGDKLYMLGQHSEYTLVWEYYYDDRAVSNKAVDITKHVFDYIPPNALSMAASTVMDMLMVVPENDFTRAAEQFTSAQSGDWDDTATWTDNTYCPQFYDNAHITGSHVVNKDAGYGPARPIAAKTATASSNFYVYRQYVQGQERKQSAWCNWTFGTGESVDSILDCAIVDNKAYLLRRSDRQGATASTSYLFIDEMSISDERSVRDDDYPYEIILDHNTELVGVGSSNLTTWTLTAPYWDGSDVDQAEVKTEAADGDDLIIVLSDNFGNNQGKWLTASSTGVTHTDFGVVTVVNTDNAAENATKITIDTTDHGGNGSLGTGHFNGYSIRVGRQIPMSVELSQVFFLSDDGKPITDGRVGLQKIIADHVLTGPYSIKVVSSPGSTDIERTKIFEPVGYDNTPLIASPVASTAWTDTFGQTTQWIHAPANDCTITIESDSPIQTTISSVEFHGVFNTLQELT